MPRKLPPRRAKKKKSPAARPPQSEALWREHFEALRAFKDVHGHVDMAKVHRTSHPLTRWTTNQRRDYKAVLEASAWTAGTGMAAEGEDAVAAAAALTAADVETLTHRKKMIEDMGFEFDRHRSRWEKRFEQLRSYRGANGHCNVPQRCKDNPSLGRWVNTQRRQQRMRAEGRDSDMTEERFRKLTKIGMVWYVKGPDQWQERFEDLRQYQRRFGHTNVPSRYEPDRMLGRWVSSQRIQYKFRQEGKHSYLTDERIRALNSLGFDWRNALSQKAAAMAENVLSQKAAAEENVHATEERRKGGKEG